MMAAIFKFLHLHTDDHPVDKLQMEAAKDRLTQRGDELEKETNELSNMIRRLQRRDRAGARK